MMQNQLKSHVFLLQKNQFLKKSVKFACKKKKEKKSKNAFLCYILPKIAQLCGKNELCHRDF